MQTIYIQIQILQYISINGNLGIFLVFKCHRFVVHIPCTIQDAIECWFDLCWMGIVVEFPQIRLHTWANMCRVCTGGCMSALTTLYYSTHGKGKAMSTSHGSRRRYRCGKQVKSIVSVQQIYQLRIYDIRGTHTHWLRSGTRVQQKRMSVYRCTGDEHNVVGNCYWHLRQCVSSEHGFVTNVAFKGSKKTLYMCRQLSERDC